MSIKRATWCYRETPWEERFVFCWGKNLHTPVCALFLALSRSLSLSLALSLSLSLSLSLMWPHHLSVSVCTVYAPHFGFQAKLIKVYQIWLAEKLCALVCQHLWGLWLWKTFMWDFHKRNCIFCQIKNPCNWLYIYKVWPQRLHTFPNNWIDIVCATVSRY